MTIVINAVYCAALLFCFYLFFGAFADKTARSAQWKRFILLLAACWFFLTYGASPVNIRPWLASIAVDAPEFICNLISVLVGLFIFSFLFELALRSRLLYVFSILLIVSLVEEVAGIIRHLLAPHIALSEEVFLCASLALVVLLNLLVAVVLRKMQKNKRQIFGAKHSLLLVFILLCHIFSLVMFRMYAAVNTPLFYIAIVFMALSAVALLFLFTSLHNAGVDRVKKQLLESQMEQQMEQYTNIRKYIDDNRQIIHDFNKHLVVMKRALDEEDYAFIRKYVDNLQDSTGLREDMVYTRNRVVDALLYHLMGRCREQNIEVRYQFDIEPGMDMDDFDLTVIIGNLFENAFEACEQAEGERWIDIDIHTDNHALLVDVSNTKPDGPVRKKARSGWKSNLPSGLGTGGIKQALKKYGGIIQVDSQSHIYRSTLVIPYGEPAPAPLGENRDPLVHMS